MSRTDVVHDAGDVGDHVPVEHARDILSAAPVAVEETIYGDVWAETAARGWHRLLLCAVAAGWAPVSLVAWLAVSIAGFGWNGNGSFDGPTLVSHPTGSAIISLGLAAVMIAIGALVLYPMSRWAIPVRRRLSIVVATVAWLWAPVAMTVWAIGQ